MNILLDTSFLPFELKSKGKVREIYEIEDMLLFVVTDRVSAFDVVFNEGIPNKGRVLNCISNFWFEKLKDICPNHIAFTNYDDFPASLQPYREQLEGRSMLVKKAKMLNAECIVRGYIEGSALKEYKATGSISGIKLATGLVQADKLERPIFTPSTKAEEGHDINISYAELEKLVGVNVAAELRSKSLELYVAASEYALSKGIILADTKFEFGYIDGELCIADELFTPDSSRFWEAEDYEPGRAQKSFDKQFLREYLETLDWDKTYPAPTLPTEVIEKTEAKYLEAYKRLTGEDLPFLEI